MTHSDSIRHKYFQLRTDAGDLSVRDKNFRAIHDLLIHNTGYEFDPKTYLSDAVIPKGGILQAIRDVG